MSQMSTEDRLVYMANQIAANFAIAGREAAVAATADHIASFWDPRMKRRILCHLDEATSSIELSPIARLAIAKLGIRSAPPAPTARRALGGVDGVSGSDTDLAERQSEN